MMMCEASAFAGSSAASSKAPRPGACQGIPTAPSRQYMGVEPKIGGKPPKMDGFMVHRMENPIKRDDLGVPLFSETSICCLILCIFNVRSVQRLDARFFCL